MYCILEDFFVKNTIISSFCFSFLKSLKIMVVVYKDDTIVFRKTKNESFFHVQYRLNTKCRPFKIWGF